MSAPSTQWLFPSSALHVTPSRTTSNYSLEKELYDRARGVEFLYRLGSSLALPSSAMFTAATWFHRFYMRCSMEDYHRQDVAASCIFLATKTEECGRKLRDVARVCQAKTSGVDIGLIVPESIEVEECQSTILLTEEILLEALCFDFVIESPHAELVDLFDAHEDDDLMQQSAWSIAHDSYRTPLCILFSPQVIATACYVLAQRVIDGPHSPSLDARISSPAPCASLPTPPSHKPASPNASRFAIEHFGFNDAELSCVSEALSILLEFYAAQDTEGIAPHLAQIAAIPPPTVAPARSRFYSSFVQPPLMTNSTEQQPPTNTLHDRTPSSSHGGDTPLKTIPSGQEPTKAQATLSKRPGERLDLS